MPSSTYTVLHADYLDREEGLEPGVSVTAEPGIAGHLNVTAIGDKELTHPIAVTVDQLKAAA